ncbi:MAG TPA: hypothetical protein VOA64_17255 [Candidatus Dormibacteraeota bacterium]|nr:hypothetical protein [Candidatus Dormibacteraeota bacterium]
MSVKTLLLLLCLPVSAGMALWALRHPRVGALFHEHIPDRPRRRLFLAAIGFFLTFAIARTLAYVNFHQIGPFHDIYIRGRHIHHLVWGILILLGVGFGWLVEVGTGSEKSSIFASRLMSFLYGAGAALTLDEFALWLNLEDVYWAREGRASIDAVVLFGAFLLIALWGGRFFHALAKEFFPPRRRRTR